MAKFTIGSITTSDISLAVQGGKVEKIIREMIEAKNNPMKLQYIQIKICL